MRTFFRLLFLGLVLLIVALVSALTSMRIAIHGREVSVPNLVGKTPAEAIRISEQSGLSMEVERQYYSATVPGGRILSEAPDAGTRVRRGWHVLVAQSLGPQRVQIPNVVGGTERAAEINMRRRGFDTNSIAGISLSGIPDDLVVAQSPTPNASDISAPRISLLVSTAAAPQSFVMPSFVGQPLGRAASVLKDAGVHLGKVSPAEVVPPTVIAPTIVAPTIPPAVSPDGIIVSQDPVSGQKILEGGVVNFSVR